jgi:hypothetical protein
MRVIALIEDPAVIERILSWLGPWDPPQACGPSPRSRSPLLARMTDCGKTAAHRPDPAAVVA